MQVCLRTSSSPLRAYERPSGARSDQFEREYRIHGMLQAMVSASFRNPFINHLVDRSVSTPSLKVPPSTPGGTRGALGILANHVGGSFPDHDRRRIGITPYHRGHDRGIRYSQAVDALDPETGIDHRHRIARWAHLAGSDWVVLSISTVTNIPFHTGGIVDPRWVQHLAAH